MRIFQISLYMSITLFVSGCMSIPGTGVSINDLVAHTEDTKKIYSQMRKESNHFSSFYDALSVANNDGEGVAFEIIRSPVLQNLSSHIHEISQNKEPTRKNISPGDFIAFAKLLAKNHNDLLSDLERINLAQSKAIKELSSLSIKPEDKQKKEEIESRIKNLGIWGFPIKMDNNEMSVLGVPDNTHETNFAKILIHYLKKYGSGEFVDRQGINISKPKITSSGISDEDIQGLATVFFEALFDAWLGTPVFYTLQYKEEPVYHPKANISKNKKPGDIDNGISIKEYKRAYFAEYFANSEDEPTANKFVKATQIEENDNQEINKEEAKCIKRASKVAGKQSKALTGITLGFLSNVNISFILGVDFAIGDNKTLMHLVQTVAEVTSRRWVEHATWKVLAKKDKSIWCDYGL